jgi:hypothetical protein
VAAWPAVTLVGSYELLMMIIRSVQVPETGTALCGAPDCMARSDPLQAQAAQAFTAELAAGRVPSVRAIRARMHVGQPRAQRLRTHLAAVNGTQQAGVTFETPRCHSKGPVDCLTGLPGRQREISADLYWQVLRSVGNWRRT